MPKPYRILFIFISLQIFKYVEINSNLFFFFFWEIKMGAFMVVLFHPGRNPTNKGALAVGIEPGLVRQSEQTLPAELSPRWHSNLWMLGDCKRFIKSIVYFEFN